MKLKIKGFWASEDYFFHWSDQLELVARVCPDIQKMLFMFRNDEALFRDIVAFNNLKVNWAINLLILHDILFLIFMVIKY